MATIILLGIIFILFQYLLYEKEFTRKNIIYLNSIFLIISNIMLQQNNIQITQTLDKIPI